MLSWQSFFLLLHDIFLFKWFFEIWRLACLDFFFFKLANWISCGLNCVFFHILQIDQDLRILFFPPTVIYQHCSCFSLRKKRERKKIRNVRWKEILMKNHLWSGRRILLCTLNSNSGGFSLLSSFYSTITLRKFSFPFVENDFIFIHTYIHTHIYIYMKLVRTPREQESERKRAPSCGLAGWMLCLVLLNMCALLNDPDVNCKGVRWIFRFESTWWKTLMLFIFFFLGFVRRVQLLFLSFI